MNGETIGEIIQARRQEVASTQAGYDNVMALIQIAESDDDLFRDLLTPQVHQVIKDWREDRKEDIRQWRMSHAFIRMRDEGHSLRSADNDELHYLQKVQNEFIGSLRERLGIDNLE